MYTFGDIPFQDRLNAFTAVLPVFLCFIDSPTFPVTPVVLFSLIAAAGHIWPSFHPQETHVVKAAFTLVLLSGSPWFVQVCVACGSLLPVLSPVLNWTEVPFGVARQVLFCWQLYECYERNSSSWVACAVVVLCKVIYHVERQMRISVGEREKYGVLHCSEHVGIYMFLFVRHSQTPWSMHESSVLLYMLICCVCLSVTRMENTEAFQSLYGTLALVYADFALWQTCWVACVVLVAYLAAARTSFTMDKNNLKVVSNYVVVIGVWCKLAHDIYGWDVVLVVLGLEVVMLFVRVPQIAPLLHQMTWYVLFAAVISTSSVLMAVSSLVVMGSFCFQTRFMKCDVSGVSFVVAGVCALRQSSVMVLTGIMFSPSLYFVGLNVACVLWTNLPVDFPEDLKVHFYTKLKGNTRSWSVGSYLFKIHSPILSWRAITWPCIAQTVSGIDWKGYEADLVIGILSGGGFIQGFVAKSHPHSDRAVLKSQVWSRTSTKEKMDSFAAIFYNKNDWRKSKTKTLKWVVPPPSGKKYQRILIVDDSVSSGKTITNCIRKVKEEHSGAEVRTCVLFAPPETKGKSSKLSLDYVCWTDHVPLTWPWGVELD